VTPLPYRRYTRLLY